MFFTVPKSEDILAASQIFKRTRKRLLLISAKALFESVIKKAIITNRIVELLSELSPLLVLTKVINIAT